MSDHDPVVDAQHAHLTEAIQGLVGHDPVIDEGSYLLGYVVLAEYAAPDGTRWFVSRQGDASGPHLYPWHEEGYLRQGLHILEQRRDEAHEDPDDD